MNIRNMILGGIVGDALGVPVEFFNREILEDEPVIDMREYGSHNQPKGTWSDDTSLTLCTIDAIIKGWNVWTFSINAMNWYKKADFTANDNLFDIGIRTRLSLNMFDTGDLHPSKCGGNTIKDNGNGALMRIHPIIVLFKDLDLNKRYLLIKEASYLTHNHDISHMCCFYYLQFLDKMKNNKMLSYWEAYSDLEKLINLNKDLKQYLPLFERIRDGIYFLNKNDIKSSGYVLHTLEASLWSLINSSTYKEAVLQAINLGDDTDTVGSVTGVMAGLCYGDIPDEWIKNIKKLDYIEEYLKLFLSDNI